MPSELFDVFVVGSVDSSPEGQIRLVNVLAGPTKTSPALVAKAIANRNLRAGHNIVRSQADALTLKLREIGALTEIRSATDTSLPSTPTLVGQPNPLPSSSRPLVGTTAPDPYALRPSLFAPPPHGAVRADPPRVSPSDEGISGLYNIATPTTGLGLSRTPVTVPNNDSGLAIITNNASTPTEIIGTPPLLPPQHTPPPLFNPPPLVGGLSSQRTPSPIHNMSILGTNPPLLRTPPPVFNPPPMGSGPPPLLTPPPSLTPAPLLGSPRPTSTHQLRPLAPMQSKQMLPPEPPSEQQANLELDYDAFDRQHKTGVTGDSLREERSAKAARIMASQQEREVSSAGGENASLDSVRCPRHGLYYNRKRASGCRKCLESARYVARRIEDEGPSFSGRLEVYHDNPGRRIIMGLLIALTIGFIPAAYHALRVAPADIAQLREEQIALSIRPGTVEVLTRFDGIESDVERTRSDSKRNTFVLWLVLSSGAMAAWYRFT